MLARSVVLFDLDAPHRTAVADLALAEPHTTRTGLPTVAADHLPIVGADSSVPGFFWLAGQGGYGIQTSAALSAAVAAELVGPELVGGPHDLSDSAALL